MAMFRVKDQGLESRNETGNEAGLVAAHRCSSTHSLHPPLTESWQSLGLSPIGRCPKMKFRLAFFPLLFIQKSGKGPCLLVLTITLSRVDGGRWVIIGRRGSLSRRSKGARLGVYWPSFQALPRSTIRTIRMSVLSA